MASIINAATSGGLITTADTSGVLALQTAGTTAVTVDASQNVTFANSASLPNTFGYKNRIINGAMVIDQRNAGASVTQTVSAVYTLDRWQMYGDVTSKFSVQQNAGAVTPPTGFTNYLGVTSLSAYTLATDDRFFVRHKIEGFNTADLDFGKATAKAITVSFWVRSSLTGTFGGSIQNGAGDRSYPFTFTINSANTWEYETITIAGDTSGTWLTTNGIGLVVNFGLGVQGSTYAGTAGAWNSNNNYSATGGTSVVSTNGATFYITGIQLEKGSTATSFDVRDYGRELIMCQRYFQSYAGLGNTRFAIGSCETTSTASATFSFIVPFRTTPSVTLPATGNSGGTITFLTATATYPAVIGTISALIITPNNFLFNGTGFTGAFVAGDSSQLYSSGTCAITASAEL